MRQQFFYLIMVFFGNYCVMAQSAIKNNRTYEVIQRNEKSVPTFIRFSDNVNITHDNFYESLNSEFGFRTEDKFELLKTSADKKGFVHYKYNQTYKGILVFGIQYNIHEKNGIASSANGQYVPSLNVSTEPQLNKDDAIKSAMKLIALKKYRWEDPKAEESIKKRSKNQNASHYPKPDLVLAAQNGDIKNGVFYLCWKFNIAGTALDKAWTVFIDAKNGNLVNKTSLIANDVVGTGQTLYNGSQSIKCVFDQNSGYYLLEEYQRGPFSNQQIYTWTANQDVLPNWNNFQRLGSLTTTFSNDPAASNVHWGIEQAYDFYNLLGRNSFDDNGTYILNLVHYDNAYNNAFWNGYDTIMAYGDGDGAFMNALVGLDVAGHEFSHAITEYTAGLIYQGESGALNESFSDVLGTCIEAYTLGINNFNWTIGEDIMVTDPYLRSMSNPKALPGSQPDTYGGINWAPTGAQDPDDGGVHTNSGVQNYWFYLLSVGGSGINDNNSNYSVTGIGINDALNIAYRNLSVYLSQSSNYNDAMNGSIASAIDLFGAGSQQEISVRQAWCAVGVGPCAVAPAASFFANTTNICKNACVSFTDNSTNNPTSWSWSFPGGTPSSSINQNPSNICYNNPGTYNVTLTATNAGGSNSKTTNGYITVNTCAGINEFNQEGTISVYPNPSDGKFTIQLSSNNPVIKYSFEVYNLLGAKIWANENQLSSNSTFEIDLTNQSSGIYFLKVISINGIQNIKINIDK